MRDMGINPKKEKQKIKEKIEKRDTDNKKYTEDTQLPQNQKPQPEEKPDNTHQKEQENKKGFSFTLKPSLVKKLDIIAKDKKRSKSYVIEELLEHLDEIIEKEIIKL
jgi:hypothetical protein